MKKIIISPSLLSADQLNFEKAISEIKDSGADSLHIDVMDGHFVPNLTFGLPLISSLKKATKLPLDVHIMVSNPDLVAESYVKAGADSLSFHLEASVHPYRTLQNIRNLGAKAGIALNPGTPISHIESLLDVLDRILLLSVNPGFSGQDFIPVVYDKLKHIQKWKQSSKLKDIVIAVDGGVSTKNISELRNLGANCFVVGAYYFNSTNKRQAVKDLHESV